MRKRISLLMVTILLSLSISSSFVVTVKAEPQLDNSVRSQIYWGITQAAGTLGYLLGPDAREAVYDFACNALSWLPTYEETGESEYVSYDTSSGLMVFTADAIQDLKNTIEDYFAQEENLPDVQWFPVISSDQLSASAFYSTTQYYQFRSVADDTPLSIITTKGTKWDYFYFKDISDCVFYYDSSSFYSAMKDRIDYITSVWGSNDSSITELVIAFARKDGVAFSSGEYLYDAQYSDSGRSDANASFVWKDSSPFFYNMYPFRDNHATYVNSYYGYIVRGCNTEQFYYVPYFASLNAYKEWLTGQSDYYRVQSSYTGGDITVNPNTDYSVVYNNISQTIQNSYAEGKDYSDILSDIQASYDASMKEISESLGNIEDNTGESNSWLEQIEQNTSEANNILEQIEQNTADSNTWLEHIDSGLFDPDGNSWFIQMYLQDMKILEAIQKGFADLLGIFNMDDSGTSDSGGDSSGGSESGDSESGDSESGDSGGDSGGSESGDSGGDSGGDTGGDSGGDIGGIGTGGDSGGSSDDSGGGKKSFWTKLGDLASVLFTSVLDLISKILFKALDGLLYLVGVVVDYAALSFDYIGALITRIKDTMLGGTDFFAAVYAEMPDELRDTIGFGCICLLISGLIGFIKAKS